MNAIIGRIPPNKKYVALKSRNLNTTDPPVEPSIIPPPLQASRIPTILSVYFGYLFAAKEYALVLIVAAAAPCRVRSTRAKKINFS